MSNDLRATEMGNAESIGEWERLEPLGAGGNGEVWRARRDGAECALKILKKTKPEDESYRRFADEISILRKLENDPGVLPILDAYLPEQPTKKNRAWLSMPLATGIKQALGERPKIENVVEAIASIAETLSRLAENGICHRDIKPENLYRFEDRWAIGDFGLAEFPDKDDVTEEGRALGPRFYIAPEMVRDPLNASGFPADVWSLAKTMWVLATGQNFPPPHPQPANDLRDSLAVLVNHPRVFHLDNLIERATCKEPEERPEITEFAKELSEWLSLADVLIPATDVSDLANEIKSHSQPFFETANRMGRSREVAEEMTRRLLSDLAGLSEQMGKTGLNHSGEPADNGNNLVKGSGLEASKYGGYGVTVSMSTPSPTTHIYECGILIQMLNDGQHRLYAVHRIRPHEQEIEVTWSECHTVQFGSSVEESLLNRLVQGLYHNLRPGLERFIELMQESA